MTYIYTVEYSVAVGKNEETEAIWKLLRYVIYWNRARRRTVSTVCYHLCKKGCKDVRSYVLMLD